MDLYGTLNEPLLLSMLLDDKLHKAVNESILYYNRHRAGKYKDINSDECVLKQVLHDISIAPNIRNDVEMWCQEYFRLDLLLSLQKYSGY
jgi:hypothetical protein